MLWKGLGSPVIDVSVKKDSLLVYVLKFFGIWRVGVVRKVWVRGSCRLDPEALIGKPSKTGSSVL